MGDVPGDNTNTQNYDKALELKGIDLSNMSPATGVCLQVSQERKITDCHMHLLPRSVGNGGDYYHLNRRFRRRHR